MQLKLGFPNLEDPTSLMWDTINPEAREAFVQALARAVVNAVHPPAKQEEQEDSDER